MTSASRCQHTIAPSTDLCGHVAQVEQLGLLNRVHISIAAVIAAISCSERVHDMYRLGLEGLFRIKCARICCASPPFCCRTSIGGHRTARSASWHNSSICLQFRPCFRNITEMQTTTRGRAASLSQGSIVTPLRRGCNVRAPVHTCPLSQPAAKIASNEVCGGSARAVAVGSLVRRAEDGAVGKS